MRGFRMRYRQPGLKTALVVTTARARLRKLLAIIAGVLCALLGLLVALAGMGVLGGTLGQPLGLGVLVLGLLLLSGGGYVALIAAAVPIVRVLVVLVIGAASVWTLYLSPMHSFSPLFDRHGLPSMIPLPDRVVYVADPYSLDTVLHGDPKSVSPIACDPAHMITLCACIWLWASPDPPAEVQQFYDRDPATHYNRNTGLGPGLLGVSVATRMGPLTASPGGALISIGLTTLSSWPCP